MSKKLGWKQQKAEVQKKKNSQGVATYYLNWQQANIEHKQSILERRESEVTPKVQ